MNHPHINHFEAGAYSEARGLAEELVGEGLPKAIIDIRTVERDGLLALTANVRSPGPHPQQDIDDWLDCVKGDVTGVRWINLEENTPDQVM